MWRLAICLVSLLPLLKAQPALEQVLHQLGENQDRASDARRTIVYRQDTWVRLI